MNIVEKKRDILRLLREQSERFTKLVSLTRWISWTGELSAAEAICDKLLLVQQDLLAIADSLVHSSNDARLIKYTFVIVSTNTRLPPSDMTQVFNLVFRRPVQTPHSLQVHLEYPH
jgi:hypothetical protein